jgi:dTDP-4-amino-4,6-dideoxygalactose transaminase
MRFIPYGHQSIDDEDVQSVVEVLKSDWLTTGPTVNQFEQDLAGYVGAQHAVAVNSGTSALDIAVQALDLPKGSEIITTPFTFAATSNAILYNGHVPVFADIDPATRNIDPDEIRKRITPKTRAIIYVDYAGHPCAIDEIRDIARDHDLRLIEDACHALGASYKGRKTGTFADMTIFSFHPVKPITTGEGGAVVTDDPELAARLKLLRSHGIDRNVGDMFGEGSQWAYDMVELGRNYRMTDIQAALGVSQLKKIDTFIKRRNEYEG